MSAHAVLAPEVPRLGRRTRIRACDRDAAHERAPRSALDDLERLAGQWQRAFDAAERALRAAADTLPAVYLQKRRRALAEERRQTAELLATVARAQGIRRVPWPSPRDGSRRARSASGVLRARS